MKVKDIKETGFYLLTSSKGTDWETLYEVIENTDEEWLKESPDVTLVIDEWCYEKEESGKKVYQTSGGMFSLNLDLAEQEVEKIDKEYKIFGSMGAYLIEV